MGNSSALLGPPEIGMGLRAVFFQSLLKLGENPDPEFGVWGRKKEEGRERNIGVIGPLIPWSLQRPMQVCWGKMEAWRQRRPRPRGKWDTHTGGTPVLEGKEGVPEGFLGLE